MRYTRMGYPLLALTIMAAPVAFAQTRDPIINTPMTPSGIPAPAERFDNRPIQTDGPIATDPNAPLGGETTNPPGVKGPVEGGSSDSPTQPPKVIAPGEGGGVQNPNLGSGNNGSSPRE
jgi:hypothetical protein